MHRVCIVRTVWCSLLGPHFRINALISPTIRSIGCGRITVEFHSKGIALSRKEPWFLKYILSLGVAVTQWLINAKVQWLSPFALKVDSEGASVVPPWDFLRHQLDLHHSSLVPLLTPLPHSLTGLVLSIHSLSLNLLHASHHLRV